MRKIKDMQRKEWTRITKRQYKWIEMFSLGKRYIASTIEIEEVTSPLTLHYESGDLTIANRGDTWLQMAEENGYIWMTAMFDKQDALTQVYFDMTNGNDLMESSDPTFEDMYLDVVAEKDGTLHILDRDELDEAYHNGDITREEYQRSISECERLCAYLRENWCEFALFCRQQMLRIREREF